VRGTGSEGLVRVQVCQDRQGTLPIVADDVGFHSVLGHLL